MIACSPERRSIGLRCGSSGARPASSAATNGASSLHSRAQQLAGFPLVNLNEGIGELQRNVYDIPVLDWGLPFRPLTWPYFIPLRWSHGARWFLRDAVLLLGVFALLSAFVEDKRTAAMAAVALLFSSAFVWWRSTVMLEFMGLLCLTGGVAARAFRKPSAPWFALTAWYAASRPPGAIALSFLFFVVRLYALMDRHAVDMIFWDEWDCLQPSRQRASPWTLFSWQHGARIGWGCVISSLLPPTACRTTASRHSRRAVFWP